MKPFRLNDDFFRHTGLMFIGVTLFNLFSLLYHFFMIRHLSPIDYSQLNTLTAFFMIVTVPANTIQTTITKFVTSFQALSQYLKVKAFLKHFFFILMSLGFSMFILILIGSSFLSSFLQITSKGLIILMGLILFFSMVTPVTNGGLQGLQQFFSLAFTLFVNGGLKLFLGILFILLGWGVGGALGAIAITYFITAILSILLLWVPLRMKEKKVYIREDLVQRNSINFSEAYRFFLPVGLTLLCFMSLTNMDLILVKHFFPPIEAGYYSIAQMIGKIILFLPLPVIMVMFPKVSMMDIRKKETFPVLIKSLMVGGTLCLITILFSNLFPSLIIKFVTGKEYSECIPLIRFFSVNMSLFSLTFILLYYHLAIQSKKFIYPLIFLTLIHVIFISLFHQTSLQVLFIVGIISLLLCGTIFYLAYPANTKT